MSRLYVHAFLQKVEYAFVHEPLDVVIPAIDKDLATLNLCIEGIRKNCSQIRRIIVISPKSLTDQAEWYDEANFPFSKQDIAFFLLRKDPLRTQLYLKNPRNRLGWYFQQLLKFYAPYVIPNISSNVLMLDADTIFLNEVKFMDSSFAGLYNFSGKSHRPYFEHARKLIPEFIKIYPDYSGVAHHMVFQKCVLDDLFEIVEQFHKVPLWQAFCLCVGPSSVLGSGASEYEIYFNFVRAKTDQIEIRPLKCLDIKSLINISRYKKNGYHYISCHSWERKKNK